jgi:hypothetical protein
VRGTVENVTAARISTDTKSVLRVGVIGDPQRLVRSGSIAHIVNIVIMLGS